MPSNHPQDHLVSAFELSMPSLKSDLIHSPNSSMVSLYPYNYTPIRLSPYLYPRTPIHMPLSLYPYPYISIHIPLALTLTLTLALAQGLSLILILFKFLTLILTLA